MATQAKKAPARTRGRPRTAGPKLLRLASLNAGKRLLDRQAAEVIRDHILSGALPPGSRLLEIHLAEQLEVSRGTVRAALAQLAHQGLARRVAFTKWEVPGSSVADAWEVYTLRAVLEGLSARLAAERAASDERRKLKATGREFARAVREKRLRDVTDIDFRIHEEITAMAGHRRLAEQHHQLLQQVRFHMVNAGFLPKDYSELIDEHERLIEAVAAGDATLAETLARTHNETEIRLLAEAMTRRDGRAEASG
jgi:DNA-binding GntR family transcriptional regulator